MGEIIRTASTVQRVEYVLDGRELEKAVLGYLADRVGQVFNGSTTITIRRNQSAHVVTEYIAATTPRHPGADEGEK